MGLSWPEIVFGWPAVVGALILYGVGLHTSRWLPALAGFVISLPFLWYLSGYPSLMIGGPLTALSSLVSVVALARGRRLVAGLALLPFVAVVLWLAYAVLAQ